ncbi:hypothetical protein GCM10022209_25330 [Chitinophaga oryziterrae]
MNHKEDELLKLIKDYIACSTYMCNTLKESYSTNGESLLGARRINIIPKEGVLEEGYFFNFHGGGCYFEFDNSSIDVDFGPDDRCDGFDSQRLHEFLESSKKEYGYSFSEGDINNSLERLLEERIVIKPGWFPNPHLFYLSDK